MAKNKQNLSNWRKRDYQNKREQILAQRRADYWSNPEKYLTANRARKRESINGDPPHEGKCPICQATKVLYYDHNHTTKKFRGWICTDCNKGIGLFHDNPEALRMAAFYLIWNNGMKSPL